MKKVKRVSALALAGLTLVVASEPCLALGFGRPFSKAILGDTLMVTVPLRLEVGEEITDECLAADVYFGDEKVSASAVKATMQSGDGPDRVLKVSTTALVNEPVVTVYLAAGCHVRMTRKFVAFADPPGMVLPSGGSDTALARSDDEPVRMAEDTDRRPARTRQERVSSSSSRSGAAASASKPSRVRTAGAGEVAAAQAEAEPMSPGAARLASEAQRELPSTGRAGLRAERSLGAADRDAEPAGRLVLDGAEMDPVRLHDLRMSSSLAVMIQDEDRSPAVLARRRTAAAVWMALNATPEELARDRLRLGELEQRLTQLTAENAQAKAALAESRQIFGPNGAGKWLAALGMLALAATGVAAFLGYRLKSRGKASEPWWHAQTDARHAHDEPAAQPAADLQRTSAFVRPATPDVDAAAATAFKPSSDTAPEPIASATAGGAASLGRHEPMAHAPVPAVTPQVEPVTVGTQAPESLRDVSVEELIDLEQQVEFFEVLGQDDAAIGLLESHLIHTTGASPLPFLKLLEIYRRLGRRADYERVQARFNQRFHGHAAGWETDPEPGLGLSEYPEIVARLQALWAAPREAMALLEQWLTQPDPHADALELPAYRELLFLYAVARDLSERPQHDHANVDLLLPPVDNQPVYAGTTMASDTSELQQADDAGQPLMSTRPIKPQPDAMPSLGLDFHLEELGEPGDAVVTKH